MIRRMSRLARPAGKRDAKGRLRGTRKTLLSKEQLAAIRQAHAGGATRDDLARLVGCSVGLIRQRLNDQLRDLPRRGRGAPGIRRQRPVDPTPDEIYGRLTAELQAKWTDEERDRKWHGTPTD